MNESESTRPENLEKRLLAHLSRENYRPVKPRVIAKQLDLADEDRPALKMAIKRLAKRGMLRYAANHVVLPVAQGGAKQSAAPQAARARAKSSDGNGGRPPSRERTSRQDAGRRPAPPDPRDCQTGVFRRSGRGFGFVRPTGVTSGRDKDVFIPAEATLDAASGDVVMVRVGERNVGGVRKSFGEIVEVIERETHRFVGTYVERLGQAVVKVDGTIFGEPIAVGDPAAKDARPGDKVVIEMVRFPTHVHPGEGVIVEVLGQRGAAGVDTLSIIHEFNLPGEFPEEVLEDARRQADAFDESIGPNRLDATGEVTITIDPVDARDFDDAVSLTRIERDHWRLGVHIADVSHFVPLRSALDGEARNRATSVYLPDRVIPMLPEVISNNLASLQPDRVRYTKTVFIEFTPEGVRVGCEPHSAAIRSRRRFTYEEVDEYLADPEVWRQRLDGPVFDLLGRMRDLARLLRGRRMARGSLELTLPEVKIDLDRDGNVHGAHVVKNTESHQIIEEFMLAANEAVAELLKDRQIVFLRRIHESPDPRKQATLTEFIRELGIEAENMENRFETQRVLARVRGRPEEHAVNFAVLRSMQKAVYSPHEEGHYALASDCYGHFTSPIRRYPDLTVHRLLDSLLAGRAPQQDFAQLVVLGQHCSEREQRAEAAERELIKVKLLKYMSERLGEKMSAVITGVEPFGMFVAGVDLPAEGLIHIDTLRGDTYWYDERSHSLTGRRAGGRYRLGDVVQVEVAVVDVDRRELDFRLVTGEPSSERDVPRRHKGGPEKKDKARGKGRRQERVKNKAAKPKDKVKGKGKKKNKRRR
jgi:ribonuclease R